MKYIIWGAVVYLLYKITKLLLGRSKEAINESLYTLEKRVETTTQRESNFKYQYWDSNELVPVSALLNFDYTNEKGEQSNRTVAISEYDGTYHLKGFCQNRNAVRTFRLDRIKNCIDAQTGEVVGNTEKIADFILNKYLKTAHYLIQSSPILRESIRVLFYIGKADSQLRGPERDVICDAFRHITQDDKLTDEDINKSINSLSPLSLQAFKLAVGKIDKIDNKYLKYVYEKSKDIINTQKSIHANETEALEYILKKIR